MAEIRDPWNERRIAVRAALPAADWQQLHDATAVIVELTPPNFRKDYEEAGLDTAEAVGADAAWWMCHDAVMRTLLKAFGRIEGDDESFSPASSPEPVLYVAQCKDCRFNAACSTITARDELADEHEQDTAHTVTRRDNLAIVVEK